MGRAQPGLINRTHALVALASTAVVGGALTYVGSRTFDDAFISYRYALNLADGHGWSFNIGESGANAASSPLYVLVLAALHLVGLSVPTAGRLVALVGFSATAFMAYLLLARAGHVRAGVVAAAITATAPILLMDQGMETPLYLAVIAGAALAVQSRSQVAVGVLIAVAVATRGEAALLALLALAGLWLLVRSAPWKALLVAAICITPWLTFSLIAIGKLLPNTLAAKQAQGDSGFWADSVGDQYIKNVRALFQWPMSYKLWLPAIGVAALVGLVTLIRSASRLHVPVATIVAFAALQTFAFAFVLRVPAYPWYYAPPAFAAIILAALGIERIAELAGRTHATSLIALATVTLMALGLAHLPRHQQPYLVAYERAGRWIEQNTPSAATVATAEIGILGWNSKRPIVDFLGLTWTEASPHLANRDLTWWVHERPPDFYLTRIDPYAMETPVLSEPWFHDVFTVAYQDTEVVLYRRIAPVP